MGPFNSPPPFLPRARRHNVVALPHTGTHRTPKGQGFHEWWCQRDGATEPPAPPPARARTHALRLLLTEVPDKAGCLPTNKMGRPQFTRIWTPPWLAVRELRDSCEMFNLR